MIIAAKFAAVCPCCSSPIVVGSKIEWSKGAKAVHAACSGVGAPHGVAIIVRARALDRLLVRVARDG